ASDPCAATREDRPRHRTRSAFCAGPTLAPRALKTACGATPDALRNRTAGNEESGIETRVPKIGRSLGPRLQVTVVHGAQPPSAPPIHPDPQPDSPSSIYDQLSLGALDVFAACGWSHDRA